MDRAIHAVPLSVPRKKIDQAFNNGSIQGERPIKMFFCRKK